jgi:hypothetical protein
VSTERFEKQAGSPVMQGLDDPSMLLVGDEIPSWVGIPPELGGGRRAVTDAFVGPCPSCRNHGVRVLVLGDLSVAECATRGFLWFRTPTLESP